MIETGLVYIYSVSPARAFKGCGALLEGGYVATCRHVWRIAAPAGQPPSPAEVEIEFPFGTKEKAGGGDKYVVPARRARLADACGEPGDSAPDLVLLGPIAPHSMPRGLMTLQLAAHERFEVGAGRAHTYLPSRKRYSAVDGRIDQAADPDGLRQFRGVRSQEYWFEKGSSGSPVFLENAQQLAGIIALSELGANEGNSGLREAFVVPATTIRKYLTARLAADALAEKRGIDPARLQPILAKLGVRNVPDDKIAERLDASVEDILAQAAKPVPHTKDGVAIETTDPELLVKLYALDAADAPEVLRAKIADIKHSAEHLARVLSGARMAVNTGLIHE